MNQNDYFRKSELTRRALLENEILRDQASLAISEASADDDDAVKAAQAAWREAQQAVIDTRQELIKLEPPDELRAEVDISDYFQAAVLDRDLDGAAKELNQEMKIDGRWDIPIGLLLPRARSGDHLPADMRATPATAITDEVDVNTRPIAERVFRETDAAWLGVGMQTVRPGIQRFPRLKNGTEAHILGEGQEADGVAATIEDFQTEPFRMTAEYVVGEETLKRVGSNLGPLLETDIRMVMGEATDDEIIAGDGASPTRPPGAMNRISAVHYPNLASGAAADDTAHTWADLRGIAFNFQDRREMRSTDSLKLLMGIESWRYGHGLHYSDMSPEPDAIQAIQNLGVAVRPSAAIPAPGAVTGTTKTTSRGLMQRALLAAHPENIQFLSWRALSLMRDPYTGLSRAQTKLVVSLLFSMAYVRSEDNAIRGCRKLNIVLENKG